MSGKELVDKHCMECGLGLYNCTIPVGKCPFIKAKEALREVYEIAQRSYERMLQEGDEVLVAYREGYMDGIKEAIETLEGLYSPSERI